MIVRTILLLLAAPALWASEANPVIEAAERHARQLVEGQPGEIRIAADPIDTSRLIPCATLETYTPPNTRTIGRTHIGVRCQESANWNILVPVRISIISNYVRTSRSLLAGKTLRASDLVVSSGDLSTLPTGTVISIDRAIGKTLRNSVGAGQALRADQLQAPLVIRQGQNVKVVSRGPGFLVKADGKAMNNAAEGELARARMLSGKTLSGIAQQDGSILLAN